MELTSYQAQYINPRAIIWIEALLSGEYKQTTSVLRDADGYCCLGVACELAPEVEWDHNRFWFDGDGAATQLPVGYKDEIGLLSSDGECHGAYDVGEGPASHCLADLNDDYEWSFKQIANHLLEYPELYFSKIGE